MATPRGIVASNGVSIKAGQDQSSIFDLADLKKYQTLEKNPLSKAIIADRLNTSLSTKEIANRHKTSVKNVNTITARHADEIQGIKSASAEPDTLFISAYYKFIDFAWTEYREECLAWRPHKIIGNTLHSPLEFDSWPGKRIPNEWIAREFGTLPAEWMIRDPKELRLERIKNRVAAEKRHAHEDELYLGKRHQKAAWGRLAKAFAMLGEVIGMEAANEAQTLHQRKGLG